MTRRPQNNDSRNRNAPAMINMQNNNIIMTGSASDLQDHLRRGLLHNNDNDSNNNTPVRRGPLVRGFGAGGHRGRFPSCDGCPARDGGGVSETNKNNHL